MYSKKILNEKKSFGKLSIISEIRDIFRDEKTGSNLINDIQSDYTRYLFFYLSYLIENKKIDEAKELPKNIDYINTTLLLAQAKSWIGHNDLKKFKNFPVKIIVI